MKLRHLMFVDFMEAIALVADSIVTDAIEKKLEASLKLRRKQDKLLAAKIAKLLKEMAAVVGGEEGAAEWASSQRRHFFELGVREAQAHASAAVPKKG